jgi:hypothetical protein
MDGGTAAGVMNLVKFCRLGVFSPAVALGFPRCFEWSPGGGRWRAGGACGWLGHLCYCNAAGC